MLSAFKKWLLKDELHELEVERERCTVWARTIDSEVNRRVADLITQLDPYEPFLKKYHGVFSKEYEKPEDSLNERDKFQLFQWAYGQRSDPYFKHCVEWLQNVQGNNTLRRAVTNEQWFFGRCAVIILELFTTEVGRLASHYDDIVRKKDSEFDEHLSVSE